jgi:predicted DCC family thiol-disulfide oxidoreductase YuxK
MGQSRYKLKLLYDGDCPFCRRDVQWLLQQDRGGMLAAEDIVAIGFNAARYGLTQAQVMGALHAVLPDGRIVRGMEAIRQAYQTVGLGWLVAPTRLPIVRPVADMLYRLFAANRVRLGRLFGRRCGRERCKVNFP